MKTFHDFDAEIQRNLLVLFAAGLFFWSALASLLPTLPLYIEFVGASKQEIGVVMAFFAIGMLLFRPQVGILADRKGRKIVLLIGMAVAAIAPLGYLLAKSLPYLMLTRAFHGISIAAFATAYTALVGDLAPENRRGEIIGYMSLVNPLGMGFGPALGGYLQATLGYTVLFLSSATLGLLGLLCILPIVNPPLIKKTQDTIQDGFWDLLLSPRVRIPAIVLLLVGLSLGTIHTFIALYIKSIGVDLNAGLFFTTAAIASFIVRLYVGKASDKYGRGFFVTLSLLAYTLAMILIWQANSALALLIGAFFEGIASGIIIPMISTMMTDRALPHERGQIFGVSLMGFDVGLAIAGPFIGYIAEQIGYRSMFAFAICLTLLAILIFITQSSKNISQSFRFALGRGKDGYALKTPAIVDN